MKTDRDGGGQSTQFFGVLRNKINARLDSFEREEVKGELAVRDCLWDIADAALLSLDENRRSEFFQKRFTDHYFDIKSTSVLCDNVVEMISRSLKARYVMHKNKVSKQLGEAIQQRDSLTDFQLQVLLATPQSLNRDNSLQALEMQRVTLEETVQKLQKRAEEEERMLVATLRKYKAVVPQIAKYNWAPFGTEQGEEQDEQFAGSELFSSNNPLFYPRFFSDVLLFKIVNWRSEKQNRTTMNTAKDIIITMQWIGAIFADEIRQYVLSINDFDPATIENAFNSLQLRMEIEISLKMCCFFTSSQLDFQLSQQIISQQFNIAVINGLVANGTCQKQDKLVTDLKQATLKKAEVVLDLPGHKHLSNFYLMLKGMVASFYFNESQDVSMAYKVATETVKMVDDCLKHAQGNYTTYEIKMAKHFKEALLEDIRNSYSVPRNH